MFLGDYSYQKSRSEAVDPQILIENIDWMLWLRKKHGQPYPKIIVVCRDGVSEGQYRMVRDQRSATRDLWCYTARASGNEQRH